MTRRRAAGLFCLAMAMRLAHLGAIHGGPLFRRLFIDSDYYDAMGRRLADGGGFPEGPFFMNVLYGLFVGGVYTMFGTADGGRLAVLILQAILGSASVVGVAKLGEVLGRPRDGFFAALLLAAWGPALFYDAALLTPSLFLFLTTFVTLCAAECHVRLERDRPGILASAIVLGALTGLLVLGRASHALLLVGWAIVFGGFGKRGVWTAVLATGVTALVVLPATLRNASVSGEFVPVTANGGMVLWAGHHERATGIYSEPPFLTNPVPAREAEDYRAEASRRAGRELTLAESSAYWTRAALDRTLADPGRAVRLALRKARLYFHATESQTNISYYFARDFSPALDVLRLHLGWVLPFVLLALFTDLRALRIAAVPVAVSFATCILFYVSSEYRHPVVPCLLLFAVSGARRALAWLRSPPMWRRAVVGAGLALLFVATNARDEFLARLQSRRVDYLNFATLAATAGDFEEAERFALESVAIDPTWSVSRAKLTEIAQLRGREDRRRIVEGPEIPPDAAALLETALAAFRDGRNEEAREAFLAVAGRHDPTRPTALNNAGLCALRLGRVAEAESLFTAAASADPTYASPLVHLGRAALARGDRADAVQWAQRALALDPSDGRAARLLARATGAADAVSPAEEEAME